MGQGGCVAMEDACSWPRNYAQRALRTDVVRTSFQGAQKKLEETLTGPEL